MKKIISILTIFLWIGNLSYFFCQTTTFDWVRHWGVNGLIDFDMDVDSLGNSYVLSCGGTQDNFNPNYFPTLYAPSSGCGAISKFDVNGNLVWVKFIVKAGGTYGGCIPDNIKVKGNYIYYTGKNATNGMVDFDLGIGVSNVAGGNCFVSKIDLNGNFQWVESFGNSNTQINDITIDHSNNLIITGK